jgi:hypothetical protein
MQQLRSAADAGKSILQKVITRLMQEQMLLSPLIALFEARRPPLE